MSRHVLSRAEALAVLGLGDSACAPQIQRAYRKLALRYHPDRHPDDPQAQARFLEIVLARDTLKRLGDAAADRPVAVPASQMPLPPPMEGKSWFAGPPSYKLLLVTIAATALLGFLAYTVTAEALEEERILSEMSYFDGKPACLREATFKCVGGLILGVNAALLGGLGLRQAFRRSASKTRRRHNWHFAPLAAAFLCLATIMITAYPLYRRPAPERPQPAPRIPHPFDELHRLYVESFIRTFQLDETQSAAARSIIDDLRLQREQRSRLSTGRIPVDLDFMLERTDLRTRLDTIPTAAQVEKTREQIRKYTGSVPATTRPTELTEEQWRHVLPTSLWAD